MFNHWVSSVKLGYGATPRMKNNKKGKWSKEEISQLRSLTAKELSDRGIAEKLNRTPNSVRGKRALLGLKKREQIVTQSGQKKNGHSCENWLKRVRQSQKSQGLWIAQ